MTPDFLVVGTKRGGSTSAYHWIAQHPEVAPCRTRKGTHYFDVNYGRGEAWFRSAFEKRRAPWRVTGEASPYYMFHPSSPARIARVLPDVRLIAVLREPVARAWSHHQYEMAMGTESLGFEEAIEREEERLRGEEERLAEDPSYDSFEFRHHAYLRRGHYAEQIERLHNHFPHTQVLVVQSEALFADPHGELSRVWDFLGVSQVRLSGLRAMKAGPGERTLPPDMAAFLEQYYRPLNDRLYQLPGVQFRWGDEDSATDEEATA